MIPNYKRPCTFTPDGSLPVRGKVVEYRLGECTGDKIWIVETDGGATYKITSTLDYKPNTGERTGVQYGTLRW